MVDNKDIFCDVCIIELGEWFNYISKFWCVLAITIKKIATIMEGDFLYDMFKQVGFYLRPSLWKVFYFGLSMIPFVMIKLYMWHTKGIYVACIVDVGQNLKVKIM